MKKITFTLYIIKNSPRGWWVYAIDSIRWAIVKKIASSGYSNSDGLYDAFSRPGIRAGNSIGIEVGDESFTICRPVRPLHPKLKGGLK